MEVISMKTAETLMRTAAAVVCAVIGADGANKTWNTVSDAVTPKHSIAKKGLFTVVVVTESLLGGKTVTKMKKRQAKKMGLL
jgi:hypothetical protein